MERLVNKPPSHHGRKRPKKTVVKCWKSDIWDSKGLTNEYFCETVEIQLQVV